MRIWTARFYHPLRSRHRGHRGGLFFSFAGMTDQTFLLINWSANGKGETTAVRWLMGKCAKLAARRAETFVGPSSPGPAKKQPLCALRVSVVNIFLKLHQAMSN